MNKFRSKERGMLVALLAAAALCVASFAQAAPASGGDRVAKMQAELQKRFAAADTNADGRLTWEEARRGMPRVFAHFDDIDTAHSGSVGLDDIQAYLVDQYRARGGK